VSAGIDSAPGIALMSASGLSPAILHLLPKVAEVPRLVIRACGRE
jgi:hypothetical protein